MTSGSLVRELCTWHLSVSTEAARGLEDPGGAGKPTQHLRPLYDFLQRCDEPRIQTVYRPELTRELVDSIFCSLRLHVILF